MASASWARVRGCPVSSRRQSCRACSSGSLTWPTPGWPGPGPSGPGWAGVPLAARSGTAAYARSRRPCGPACGRAARSGPAHRGASSRAIGSQGPRNSVRRSVGAGSGGRSGFRVDARPDAELLLDLLLDLVREVRVVPQEVAGVLLALAELVAFVGVPGSRLADDGLLDPQVDQPALTADPGTENDVALRDL